MTGNNESMSNLRVSLNLDAAQFTQSLTDINRRMKGVRSEFEATSDGTREYADSLDGLRAKGDMLTRQMKLQQNKVDELRRRYEQSKEATGETSAATERLATQYNKARGQMNKTERSLKQVTDAIEDQTNKTKKAKETLEDFSGKAKSIGGGLTAGITAPILGVGGAFIKMADDADASQSRIQRSLGLTEKETEKSTKVIGELWREGMGDSKQEVEDALLSVRHNFKDIDEGEVKRVTQDAMYLAQTFDADVNEVTRAGNNLMKGFGETSDRAFDLMAYGAQNGLNFSQEMFDNLAEYSPLYKDMGFTADEYFQLLIQGTEAGVYNLDYLNDAMKEFQVRTKDGSEATSDAIGDLSKDTQGVFKEFENGKATVKDLHNAVIKDLSSMDDKTKANQIGVALYGTKWEDMEADTMFALGNIEGGLEGVDGAMDKSGKAVEKTFGEKSRVVLREFTDSVVPIGERLIELSERILPKLETGVDKMVGWWDDLTPKTQDLVLAIGGIAAVVGPAVAGFGFLAGAVAPVIGLIGGAGGIGAALAAFATGPVGIALGSLALLGGGFALLKSEMDKPLIKAVEFEEGISASTEKAMTSYLNLQKEATAQLDYLRISQGEITDEIEEDMVETYDRMYNLVLEKMKTKHAEQLEESAAYFLASDVLTEEQEAKALQKQEQKQLEEQEKLDKHHAKKLDIIRTANEENRSLTEAENAEIARLDMLAQEQAVTTMSESAKEQEALLKSLQNNKKVINTETALETFKISKEQKEKVVDDAQETYEGTIEWAKSLRKTNPEIKEEEVQDIIREAELAKNKSIAAAEDTHDDVVAEAQAQASEHASEINWETGEVLDGWDRMYNTIQRANNWVRDLFGLEPKPYRGSVKENKRQTLRRQNAELKAYALGTKKGNHPGGPALVGEEGPELAYMPNTGMTVVGQRGPEVLNNLPRGSAVLPAHHTAKILGQYNFPAYAEGVGDWGLFDILTKGASGAWDFLKDKFSIKNSILPDKFRSAVDTDFVSHYGGMAIDAFKKMFNNFMGGDGSGNVAASFGGLRKTSSFGYRMHPIYKTMRLHAGDDYAGQMNTPIRATAGGKVTRSGPSGTGWGTMVKIQNGMYSYIYAHLNKALARIGSFVTKGSLIGLLGNTGASTGPHLHYEVHKNGVPIKPNAYAKGGFISKEQMALVGEGGKKEVVIPLEQYSARARELWMQAGMKLGMLNPTSNGSMKVGNMQGVGSTVHNHYNSYNISVAYTGSTNDADVSTLAQKIKQEFERQDAMMSRSYGVI